MESIFGDHKVQNGNGVLGKLVGGSRKLSIVDSNAKEVGAKFNRLSQLIEQLNEEEINIREQMRKNCADLRGEVEQMESKQKKIRELFQNFKTLWADWIKFNRITMT